MHGREQGVGIHRVFGCGIRGHDQYGLRLGQIVDGIGHAREAKAVLQAGQGKPVSVSGGTVHIIGSNGGAHEALEEIALFVGAGGGGHSADAVRSKILTNGLQVIRREPQGLFPGAFLKGSVLSDQGTRQPIRIRDELVAETAGDT